MASAVQSAGNSEAILSALNVNRTKADDEKAGMGDRFLKLLVTQLKNQDPLNPMDNAQVTSQLAQISTVDGINQLNQTLQALVSSSAESQSLQAASLVGHGVLVPGSGLGVHGGAAIGGIEVLEPADNVTVTIKDSNGLVMRTLELGARGVGSQSFQWDGTTDTGEAVADGAYRFDVTAQRGGAKTGVNALELGVVLGVTRSSAGVSLDMGALGQVPFNAVKQII